VGLFKKIGNFVGDVVKGSVAVLVAPVNSVTGHTYKPKYKTKAGATLAGGAIGGVDSVHAALKSFANIVTLGYASKATNIIRKKAGNAPESLGNYNELKKETPGALGKYYDKYSKKGAVVLGSLYGGKVLADKIGEEASQLASGVGGGSGGSGDDFKDSQAVVLASETTGGTTGGGLAIVVIVLVVIFLIRKLF